MTTVQPPRTRARRGTGDGALDEVTIVRRVPDWVRRQQRQERRLRRTVALALVLLVAGAVLARWREDPGTMVAAGTARMSAALTSADQNRASPSDSGVETGDASAGGPRTDPVAPGTAPGIPESSATAHADTEEPPASEPTPATSQQPVPDTVAYGIDIEDGLPVSAADFAAVVHTVLVDDRGWQAKDDMRFVPVSPAERTGGARVDILVTLASPTLTAKLCAPLNTSVQQVSCWNGSRAVLNLTRWMRGASTYGDDLAAYRDYLVSHEVGHGLGHGHVHCPGAGRPAPVMVQQTKDLEGCTAWPWPTDP
jgi:hypothetical protein